MKNSIVGCFAFTGAMLAATAAFASQHSVSGEGSSVLQPKAWASARSAAMSQVPRGSKNVSAGFPSCSKDNGNYTCTVDVTYEDDE